MTLVRAAVVACEGTVVVISLENAVEVVVEGVVGEVVVVILVKRLST